MLKYRIFFIVFLLFFVPKRNNLSGKATLHPVHVSYTNVEYDNTNKEFKILYKIFVDDFDKIIQQKYGVNLELEKGKKKEAYEKIITKYILEHFKLIIDSKDYTKLRLKFSDSEVREKAIWLYYKYRYNGKSANFEVWNSLMTDLYRDQTNLLIFTFSGNQVALRFTNSKIKEQISF